MEIRERITNSDPDFHAQILAIEDADKPRPVPTLLPANPVDAAMLDVSARDGLLKRLRDMRTRAVDDAEAARRVPPPNVRCQRYEPHPFSRWWA